jgi:hypothetical protein
MAGGNFLVWDTDVVNNAYVACITRQTSSTNPLYRIQGFNVTDCLFAFCNGHGERTNLENDWDVTDTNKDAVNFSMIGHASDDMIAFKSDAYANDAAHSKLIGWWDLEYGVDVGGNVDSSNAFPPWAAGLNDIYGAANPGWTDAANGDYTPTPSSVMLNRIPAGYAVVPYDYNGNPINNSGTGAAGAIQPAAASGGGGFIGSGYGGYILGG